VLARSIAVTATIDFTRSRCITVTIRNSGRSQGAESRCVLSAQAKGAD
jgi:hypothetical protein